MIDGSQAAIVPQAIEEAIKALGYKMLELQQRHGDAVSDPMVAFNKAIGKTVIYVYPEKEKVDGINYAVNCGWQGAYAKGCQVTELFPEQDFPEQAWLILIAGKTLSTESSITGTALVTHEFAHNVTWSHGHLRTNLNGFNFVLYVGLDFAVENMDAFGVQAGRDTYLDETARDSNLYWQSELTADAIASWALDQIGGPYEESVRREVEGMLLCYYYHDDPSC
jgi:hypothetical protein